MKKSQLFITLFFLAALVALNFYAPGRLLAGLPWYGWAAVAAGVAFAGVVFALSDAASSRRLLVEPPAPSAEAIQTTEIPISKEDLERIDPDGPAYPHPVIFPERCIGCHACVEACPHDVLAIVNGIATPIARDQCMEDTSCQIECPVNPKACIVVNTTKIIPPRKVPARDSRFQTNVPGCYIIGDVSGTPLIKNAANEGADVILHIAEELRGAVTGEPRAELDVAIIGVGPAGLSAAITAEGQGLRYVAIEQDRVLATIEAYPANKYVFFKPETMQSRGPVEVTGPGRQREEILEDWRREMTERGARVNELESCKKIERAEDGDYFHVRTEQGPEKRQMTYKARRVVLALGNRGTPMRLKVPGEDLKIEEEGGTQDRVRYKLDDPERYRGRRVVVVGAGNSAIEAAVDLVARRRGDRIELRPPNERNEVSLIIRSDLKNDLKFLNKQQVYDCIDEGIVRAYFGVTIKEIRDGEVVLMNARTLEEVATLPNDFVFALIGGDRPTRFLESIGIKIG